MSRHRVGLRDRWYVAVLANRKINGETRALLLHMHRTMTDHGRVSIPRKRLADEFDVHERRISERTAMAVAAGLLSKCGGGYTGLTTMYEATIPTSEACGFAAPNIRTL